MCHDLNSTSICLLHHSTSHDHLHDDKYPNPNSIHKLSNIITAQCDDDHLLTHDQQLHEQFIDPSTQHRKSVVQELRQLGAIGCPMICLGLLLYGRMVTSMYFLGRLGELELAGGSLAIGLANITSNSVLSGLALGMEPICGQAFGAKKWHLMGLALQRTILLLLCLCLPIGVLWLNMHKILVWFGQDQGLSDTASTYLLYSLPDLVAQSILNPLRIYLRTQNITSPLTHCTSLALLVHVGLNYLLVHVWGMGIKGVALASTWTDFNLLFFLLAYIFVFGIHKRTWVSWSRECVRGWKPLLYLAIPSCISVCLEWWWYELMIVFSSSFPNARASVSAMGILIQVTSLVYIFPSSLSLAVSTRVGHELGANMPDRARHAARVALMCAMVLALLAMSFTTSMRHVWGSMFTHDDQTLSLVSAAMPIVGLCELGNCPQTTGCGILRGSARPAVGSNINLGSFYIIGLPVALFLGLKIGFVGLWCGLLAAQATCALLMLLVLGYTNWDLQALKAKQLTSASVAYNPSTLVDNIDDAPKYEGINSNIDQYNELNPSATIYEPFISMNS